MQLHLHAFAVVLLAHSAQAFVSEDLRTTSCRTMFRDDFECCPDSTKPISNWDLSSQALNLGDGKNTFISTVPKKEDWHFRAAIHNIRISKVEGCPNPVRSNCVASAEYNDGFPEAERITHQQIVENVAHIQATVDDMVLNRTDHPTLIEAARGVQAMRPDVLVLQEIPSGHAIFGPEHRDVYCRKFMENYMEQDYGMGGGDLEPISYAHVRGYDSNAGRAVTEETRVAGAAFLDFNPNLEYMDVHGNPKNFSSQREYWAEGYTTVPVYSFGDGRYGGFSSCIYSQHPIVEDRTFVSTEWQASSQIVPQGSMRLFDKNLAVSTVQLPNEALVDIVHCHLTTSWFDRYNMLDDGLQTAQLRFIKELFDGANVTDDAGVTKPIRSATSMFLGDANVVTEQYYDGFLPGNAVQLGDVMYDHVERFALAKHIFETSIDADQPPQQSLAAFYAPRGTGGVGLPCGQEYGTATATIQSSCNRIDYAVSRGIGTFENSGVYRPMEGFLRQGNTAEVTGPGAGPKSQRSTEFQRYDNDHSAVYLTVKFTEPPSSANTYLWKSVGYWNNVKGFSFVLGEPLKLSDIQLMQPDATVDTAQQWIAGQMAYGTFDIAYPYVWKSVGYWNGVKGFSFVVGEPLKLSDIQAMQPDATADTAQQWIDGQMGYGTFDLEYSYLWKNVGYWNGQGGAFVVGEAATLSGIQSVASDVTEDNAKQWLDGQMTYDTFDIVYRYTWKSVGYWNGVKGFSFVVGEPLKLSDIQAMSADVTFDQAQQWIDGQMGYGTFDVVKF